MKTALGLKLVKSFKSLCRKGDTEGVYQFLIKHKAEIYKDYISYKGDNLLVIAINSLSKYCVIEKDSFLNLIQGLIDIGVEVNFITKGLYQETVLNRAILADRDSEDRNTANKLTLLLLNNGANVNLLPPSEENSPLMQASLDISDFDVYKLILSKTKPENINAKGPEGYYDGPLGGDTAAHWACYSKRLDYMNALLEVGADYLIQDVEDYSAIEVGLNLDEHRFSSDNISLNFFTDFLSNNPDLIEKEYARLEEMKNNPKSPLLTISSYLAHKNYHDYISFLKQKLTLEANINLSSPKTQIKTKI